MKYSAVESARLVLEGFLTVRIKVDKAIHEAKLALLKAEDEENAKENIRDDKTSTGSVVSNRIG